MTRFPFLIGLSIILIFNSCQSNQNKSEENKLNVKDSIDNDVKTVYEQEVEITEIDTLTVQDRKLEGGNFHSHIKLDFALAKVQIKDTSKIRLINKICAISVIPDTSWINKQQKEMGDDWNEVVSDNQYYDQLAIDTLKSLDIPTYFAPREKRFINFIKEDKSNFMVDLTKMKDAWGLILFNGFDNPVLWSNTDIDSELKEIYKK
ncbi:hypothetical protein GQR60_18175 [Labilibaculum sp. A4]|uniref:hypothetical protein n=1 Tax=Labilibaculum euxinus TaxID=2686357 RepID=UPI000F61A3AF|nr:hypothetical protein [Labilibaculum euxinus]MDQ1772778.1 hypothetical protein [Labilibaculum euxinus]MWN78265.1 hypothetical protein [Labilibaculum euxinus]